MHPLRSFGNDIYLKEPWTHNIYKIEKDRCYEKYRINITNGGYPERPEDMNSDTYIKIVGTKVHMADYVILEDYALFYFSKMDSLGLLSLFILIKRKRLISVMADITILYFLHILQEIHP